MEKLLKAIVGEISLEYEVVRNFRRSHAVSHELFDQSTALSVHGAANEQIDIRMRTEISSRKGPHESDVDAFAGCVA